MNRIILALFVVISTCFVLSCSSGSSQNNSDYDADDAGGETETAETETDAAPLCKPLEGRPASMTKDETFDVGPYISYTNSTSSVVMWRTLAEADGKLVWGKGDALDRETPQTGGAGVVHAVKLTGLEPGTRYSYKAVSGAAESAVHSFYSAPADEASIRFAAVGDSQGHPEILAPIIAQMAAFEPYFVLHVGDAVQDPKAENAFKTEFHDAVRPLAHQVPFFLVIGNHEKENAGYYDYVDYPKVNGKDMYESTYSVRFGNVFMLVYNTNQIFASFDDAESTLSAFIKERLASEEAQTATWRIAAAHEPGYSEGWGGCYNEDGSRHYDGLATVREWMYPLLNRHKFHLYLSGHAHGYQRGQVDGGVIQVVTGGGGGGLDEWCGWDWPAVSVAKAAHHHVQIEAGCETLKLNAVDKDGNVIDFITLTAKEYGKIVEAGEDYHPPADGDEETAEE
jgi:hypothetical protein